MTYIKLMPNIKKKTEKSRHKCPLCGEQIDVGAYYMHFVHSIYNWHVSVRQMHIDCWLKRYGTPLTETTKYLRKPMRLKIKKNQLLEAL